MAISISNLQAEFVEATHKKVEIEFSGDGGDNTHGDKGRHNAESDAVKGNGSQFSFPNQDIDLHLSSSSILTVVAKVSKMLLPDKVIGEGKTQVSGTGQQQVQLTDPKTGAPAGTVYFTVGQKQGGIGGAIAGATGHHHGHGTGTGAGVGTGAGLAGAGAGYGNQQGSTGTGYGQQQGSTGTGYGQQGTTGGLTGGQGTGYGQQGTGGLTGGQGTGGLTGGQGTGYDNQGQSGYGQQTGTGIGGTGGQLQQGGQGYGQQGGIGQQGIGQQGGLGQQGRPQEFHEKKSHNVSDHNESENYSRDVL